MIYTVTVNPAIDYMIEIDALQVGEIHPYLNQQYAPGGKGVNVSLMLSALGEPNTALGICSGFSGEEIIRLLRQKGCIPNFVFSAGGHSRVNIKVYAGDGRETDFNGKGPELTQADVQSLFDKLRTVSPGDYVVLAGSLPAGVEDTLYADICKILDGTGAQVVVDAVGSTLLHTLAYRPFLIKPNHEELGELFDVKIETRQQAEEYGKKLLEMGAQNVLVSMGSMGALLLQERDSLFMPAVSGQKVSTVGAGDSMVAGFLHGYIRSFDMSEGLKLGTAAGAATAFTKSIASAEEVQAIYAAMTAEDKHYT